MLAGILLGYLLRGQNVRFIQPCITLFIWLLLLLLGIEVGSNEQIVRGLHTLGVEALVLTLCGTLGSVLAARGVWQLIQRQERGKQPAEKKEDSKQSRGSTGQVLRGSLIIVGFFALGVVVGLLKLIPFDVHQSGISFYALYALMISVGMSMGSDPLMFQRFRSLNPRVAMLPIATIVGTLSGTAVIALLWGGRSIADYLAVGSGFGYYSLSSILITELRGAELGTVALLANICRELLTMLAAPLLLRWFGPLAPISSGGATSMDSTLPIITRTCGEQFVVVTIFHGFLVDFSVPFLVTFFCSL